MMPTAPPGPGASAAPRPAQPPVAFPGMPGMHMGLYPAQMAALQQRYLLQAMAAGKGGYYPFPPMQAPPYPSMLPMMGGYPGSMPVVPTEAGIGQDVTGGQSGTAGQEKGKGKKGGKGKGKGKGSGKGKKASGEGRKGEASEGDAKGDDGERKLEKLEGIPAIVQAQKNARIRFEKDVLDRVQGRWQDGDDEKTFYTVEGSLVSVANGEGKRVFRNRLSVYGSEMCWDAKRFWHALDLKTLHNADEEPSRLEWNPGKDSAPTQKIVWKKVPDLPKDSESTKRAKDAVNRLRRLHGAPQLEWSEECYQLAKDQAEACAESGALSNGNTAGPSGEHGQCLHKSPTDEVETVEEVVDAWYASWANYLPGEPVGCDATQLLWKSSTHFAIAHDEKAMFWVANFLPAGNVVSHFAENVNPKKSAQASTAAEEEVESKEA